jgi:competence protein ComEC
MRPMPTSDASAPSIAEPLLQTGADAGALGWWARTSDRIEERLDRERDQLPLWLPVGLGFGIAAWFALPDPGAWLALILCAAAGVAGSLALGWDRRWTRAVAMFLLAAGLGCGLIWSKAERVAAPRLERAKMSEFSGVIETVQRLPAREAVRLVVRPIQAPDLPPRLRINIAEADAGPELQAGAKIRLRAWLMPPAPMAVPGAYDFARAAWFQQIGGTGRAVGKVTLLAPASQQGWQARLASVRQRLADHCPGATAWRAGRHRSRFGDRGSGRHSRRGCRGDAADPGWRTSCR